ncbi:hydantoinase/oxoprolinase N-terminal domain-containing protein, partial [Candidatus Williamhamiltonella defendens]
MNYSMGIDVGGTHTDAVLLNSQQEIVAFTKQPITADVMQGIGRAVEVILAQSSINPAQIDRAMLGTTHCTNAIVERKNLEPVAHFRLGAPATLAVLPLVNIPANFREKLSVHLFTVSGGYHYDG